MYTKIMLYDKNNNFVTLIITLWYTKVNNRYVLSHDGKIYVYASVDKIDKSALKFREAKLINV